MIRTCMAVLASIPLLMFAAPTATDAATAQASPLNPCAQDPQPSLGRYDDFDGDGRTDVVIGIPGEDLHGTADAGRIEIRYGDGRVESLHAPDYAAGDRFGTAFADLQVGNDVCSDLVVGAPGWDDGTARDMGVLFLYIGTPDGLRYQGRYEPGYAGYQHGAHLGAALAGALPDLPAVDVPTRTVVYAGSPGTDIIAPDGVGEVKDTGAVLKLSFSLNADGTGVTLHGTAITEASDGVDGAPGAGDHFGASISADGRMVGAPDRTVHDQAGAGAVFVHPEHDDDYYRIFTQDSNGFPGMSEAGDHFGASVLYHQQRKDPYYVGIPGESIGSIPGAGNVMLFGRDGIFPGQAVGFRQGKGKVHGTPEPYDHFGAVFGEDYERVLVGTPDEDVRGVKNAGAVFALYSTRAGDGMVWTQNTFGVPGTPEKGDRFGSSLGSRGPQRAVVGVTGENSGTGMVLDGLPTDGTPHFWNQKLGAPEAGDGFGSSLSSGVAWWS